MHFSDKYFSPLETYLNRIIKAINDNQISHPNPSTLDQIKRQAQQILDESLYQELPNFVRDALEVCLKNSLSNLNYVDYIEELSLILDFSIRKGKEFPGYKRKTKELSELIEKYRRLSSLIQNGEVEKFEYLLETNQENATSIKALLDESQENVKSIKNNNDDSQNAITSLQALQKEWEELVEERNADTEKYRNTLSELIKTTNTLQSGTNTLVNENTKLKEELKGLIEQTKAELKNALDIATFREFSSVCDKKEKSNDRWMFWAILVSIAYIIINGAIFYCTGAFKQSTLQIINNNAGLMWSILLPKFLITFPLLGIATFFFQRYLKEQRLTEEYRFKATCALHFNSYMELVAKLATDETEKEYRDFLISQINRLFTSPTERVYKNSNPKSGDLNQLVDLLSALHSPLEKVMSFAKGITHADEESSKTS